MRWRSFLLAALSITSFTCFHPAEAESHPGQAQGVQAPARDIARPRTGTSRIRGRVLAAETSVPIRRAVVRLTAPELGANSRSKMTDAEGKYEFTDLPAGSYSIIVSKTGFVSGAPGTTGPGEVPKTVKLGEAEAVMAGDVVLMRASAIAGRVMDEFGEPVTGAQVSVLRSRSIGGVRRLMPANGASTNDLGQFRAYGLQPGTYFVSARVSMGGDVETDDRLGYAPTYYPGTANPNEAQPLQVSAGQDLTGIEITLTTARVARISGFALDSRGRPAANSSVSVMPLEAGMAFGGPSSYGRVQQDGTFTANNVPPGDYLLELRVNPTTSPGAPAAAPRIEYGYARVAVAGSDLTGLTIQATAGATLSGQVVFDGASPPAKARLTVIATSLPTLGPVTGGPTGPPAQVAADGTFVLTGVFGSRLLRVGGQPAGWMVKAVYADGREVTDTPINVEGREQITGVQIILTDRITHITASVNDEDDRPAENAYVIVVPNDPARLTPGSRYQRSALLRPGTPLKIDGLPAGDYIALAFKSLPRDFDPYDPDVFDYARKAGTKFSLRDAETRDLTLRLIEPPAK